MPGACLSSFQCGVYLAGMGIRSGGARPGMGPQEGEGGAPWGASHCSHILINIQHVYVEASLVLLLSLITRCITEGIEKLTRVTCQLWLPL